jgi:hypothetical protein
MIVRALQMQGAQHAVKAFTATPGVARLPPTTAGQARPGVIGGVGIESRFDGAGGQLQRLLAHGHFQRLQVQFVDGLAPHERLNLVHDVGGQERGE